jgi:hypothetical protein
VKVSIVRSGGPLGQPMRNVLDEEWLPPDARAEFRSRAQAVGEAATAERGSLGETLYAVQVDDGGRVETGHYSDLTVPEDVRKLIAFVDDRPESKFVRPQTP